MKRRTLSGQFLFEPPVHVVADAADNKPDATPPVMQSTQAPVEAANKTGKPAVEEGDHHKQATSVPDVQAEPPIEAIAW